ncbi:MAG: phosphomannomutase [Mesorhizobium amorphae]|nr:MAG: phosphomannomutase [Mesorhizobium amorphae]
MQPKFGTSGLRGLSADLVAGVGYAYAAAFSRFLIEEKLAAPGDAVLLGYDLRDSSPAIARDCARAVAEAGLVPRDCGLLPTPALAFEAHRLGRAAMMVTGSHIPADRNGIKFYKPAGEIDKADERAISERAAAGVASTPPTELPPTENGASEALEGFRRRYLDAFPAGALGGLRVGIYEHSTVARDLLREIVAGLGADVVPLGRSDIFVAVDTEATDPRTEENLRIWSAAHKLDAIVSADGDGDRPLLAGAGGELVRGDVLGLLTAKALGARVVVTPVTSSSGIESALDAEVVRTRVGSPFVIAGMDEAVNAGKTAVLGFEANGGVLAGTAFALGPRTLGALPTRDSVLPILAVLFTAASRKVRVADLVEELKLPVSRSDRVQDFPSDAGQRLLAELSGDVGKLQAFLGEIGQVASFDTVDGLRVALRDGPTIHFRASGNAPEMRCYVEADTPELADRLLARGMAELREARG